MFPHAKSSAYSRGVVWSYELNVVDNASSQLREIEAHLRQLQDRVAKPAEQGCHVCGNPSPGDKCRYCETVHREPEPLPEGVCGTCLGPFEYRAMEDPLERRTLLTKLCDCDDVRVYEIRDIDRERYGSAAEPKLVRIVPNPRYRKGEA